MIRKTSLRCLPSILTVLAGLIGASGGASGAAADADGAKQAAEGLDKAADFLRERIRDKEPRPTSPEAQPSPLTINSILLCKNAERLVVDTKTYFLTRSFIDLNYCNEALTECHERLLHLRREARKLPAGSRKGLLKDVMNSFRKVDVALNGGNGRHPIPHDPVLDEIESQRQGGSRRPASGRHAAVNADRLDEPHEAGTACVIEHRTAEIRPDLDRVVRGLQRVA